MNPHDDPESSSHNPRLHFSDCREGVVLVSSRRIGSIDFYLVVIRDEQTKRLCVRTVDGAEFWTPWWAFDAATTQAAAEAAGARWRVPPQVRPGLVGPPRHPAGIGSMK